MPLANRFMKLKTVPNLPNLAAKCDFLRCDLSVDFSEFGFRCDIRFGELLTTQAYEKHDEEILHDSTRRVVVVRGNALEMTAFIHLCRAVNATVKCTRSD